MSLRLPISTENFPFAILGIAFFTRASLLTNINFLPETSHAVLEIGRDILISDEEIIEKLWTKLPLRRHPPPKQATTFMEQHDRLLEQMHGLNYHLTLRTFFDGDEITVNDWILWGALRGSVKAMGITKNGDFPHLHRWFSFIDGLPSTVEALTDLTRARRDAIKASITGHAASFDLYLTDAIHGQVVTRFPPEPSGYPHIGHIKAAMLNDYFARRYGGKSIIRFDDTNPAKEKEEYEQAILTDLEELGIHGDAISHSSDYFPQLYAFAVKLMKARNAYVDDTDKTRMNEERRKGWPSANRDRTIEDNLSLFGAMKAGTELGLRCCLRAKISVDNPNKAMRDPVIYRCISSPHPRTGDSWEIFPTYDFACPAIDSLEGVTHALRYNEYRDRNASYEWVINTLDLRPVRIWDFRKAGPLMTFPRHLIRYASRLNFVYAPLSKRVFRDWIDNGLASGWDDPRLPTFRGIRRRDMTIEALRQFMLSQGPSQNQVLLEWASIWALNKKIADPLAPRFCAILKKDLVHVSVQSFDWPCVKLVPKHKKAPQLGDRRIVFSDHIIIEQEDAKFLAEGEEIVLMNWGVAVVLSVKKDDFGLVTNAVVDLGSDGDVKNNRKIAWLPDPQHHLDLDGIDYLAVPVALLDYDHLITSPKLKKGENAPDWANTLSEPCELAWAEGGISTLRRGDIIQLERKGYYVVDSDFASSPQGKMTLIRIPDGKAQSSTLK